MGPSKAFEGNCNENNPRNIDLCVCCPLGLSDLHWFVPGKLNSLLSRK